jgi:hypothetical protein
MLDWEEGIIIEENHTISSTTSPKTNEISHIPLININFPEKQKLQQNRKLIIDKCWKLKILLNLLFKKLIKTICFVVST